MKKRILSIVLALTLCFGLAGTAFADGGGTLIVESDGTQHVCYRTEDGGKNMSGSGWTWDADKGVLTLNGFNGKHIMTGNLLKIVLAGKNSCSAVSMSTGYDNPPLVLEGSGELDSMSHLTMTRNGVTTVLPQFVIGNDVVLSGLTMTGGMSEGASEPLTVVDSCPVTSSGEKAVFVHIGPGKSSNSTTTPATTSFTDVKESDWFYKEVSWAVSKGIANGVGNGKFAPNQKCSNAEILTLLWRAYGEPEPTIANPFSNVSASDYYYKPALWAYEKGMLSGKTFDAKENCTRAMAVTYLWQGNGKPSSNVKFRFDDVPDNASYLTAVMWAYKNNITSGVSETKFAPNETCTRAQILAFIYRDRA